MKFYCLDAVAAMCNALRGKVLLLFTKQLGLFRVSEADYIMCTRLCF